MIAACPKCNARYRVDPQRLGADGARLKCAKCAAVFRVRPPAMEGVAQAAQPATASDPQAAAPATPPSPVAAVSAQPTASPQAAVSAAPEQPNIDPGAFDSERLVVVADPEEDSGKSTIAALQEWGLQGVLVHDGVEAMLTIQRLLPRAVVLDAALPKMYGFQVCEVLKRNDSLRGTTVALVGAIHLKDRYRRPPSELYGADVYLERPDLPDGLKPILIQAGLPVDGHPAAPAPNATAAPVLETPVAAPMAATPAPAVAEPTAPAPATQVVAPTAAATATEAVAPAADDGLGAEREKAERLARIIVSDIVLYNAEKFDAAAASGNVVEALGGDLSEGRGLFEQRIDPRVRDERDYLIDELRRVAAERANR